MTTMRTPGAWEVRHDDYRVTVHNDIGIKVVDCGYARNLVAEANALLIAAAPDLLAACERTLERLGDGFKTEAEAVEYWSALRAAIAKAKGTS